MTFDILTVHDGQSGFASEQNGYADPPGRPAPIRINRLQNSSWSMITVDETPTGYLVSDFDPE